MNIVFQPDDMMPAKGKIYRVKVTLPASKLVSGLVPNADDGCVVFYCMGLRPLEGRMAEALGVFIPGLLDGNASCPVILYRKWLPNVTFPVEAGYFHLMQMPPPPFFNLDEESARAELADLLEQPAFLASQVSDAWLEVCRSYELAARGGAA